MDLHDTGAGYEGFGWRYSWITSLRDLSAWQEEESGAKTMYSVYM